VAKNSTTTSKSRIAITGKYLRANNGVLYLTEMVRTIHLLTIWILEREIEIERDNLKLLRKLEEIKRKGDVTG
jgi:hypothetical protein